MRTLLIHIIIIIMGVCCSKPGEELPAATQADIDILKEKGHLPCCGIPKVDAEGKNNLHTVYVAEYENGTELTFLFLDEDRPNKCEDCLYDTIRRPLFGRKSDIETIIIVGDKVIFPGTFADKQTWDTKTPQHNHAEIELSQFENKGDGDFVVWVNTWNHLLGNANNNTSVDVDYCTAMPCGSMEDDKSTDFVIRKGSRAEVDARFKGIMTSVSTVMTPETEEKLGKRVF